MKLYLVRHGEALSSLHNGERPLSEVGQQEIELVGQFLHKNNVSVMTIFHSGKLRARETAQKLAAHIKSKPEVEVLSGLQPDDPIESMVAYCNACQEDTMLVGHLPFMAKLASELIFNCEEVPCLNFRTGSILCLERISHYQWCISFFLIPDLLSKLLC